MILDTSFLLPVTLPAAASPACGFQAAAAAAQQAEAGAQGSAVQAGQAEQAAQAVARALLLTKRAEIEATDMLEKTKNPKDADPAAAELLKVSILCPKRSWG